MSDKTTELFELTQKAQKMEVINEELALKLYLEIFEKHIPKISRTYESTIRLLEKRQRFHEALTICNQAIDLILKDEISATVSKYTAIRERLERKIAEQEPPIPEKQPRNYQNLKVLAIFILSLTALFVFLAIFGNQDRTVEIIFDEKEGLEGGIGAFLPIDESEESDVHYPITDEMIEIATQSLLVFNDVRDSEIIPQGKTLGIAIIVEAGTSESRAKELAVHYLQTLAGAASAAYRELSPPTGEELGEIYQYYDLVIVVSKGVSSEDFIAKGTKGKNASRIFWRQMD